MPLPRLPTIDDLLRPAVRQVPRAASQTPLPDDDSLLDDVIGGSLSTLGFIGHVLDTPGSWVRNTLGGENPFKGTFDPDQRTTGRQLLERAGFLDRNTPGLDWGDVAGFGAEVITDPLLWLTGGAGKATTAAGKVAQAGKIFPETKIVTEAGKSVIEGLGRREASVTKTLADVYNPLKKMADAAGDGSEVAKASLKAMDMRATALGTTVEDLLTKEDKLSSMFRYHIPGIVDYHFGTSPKLAGALDTLGTAIRYSGPGREVSRLFSYAAKGFGEANLQQSAKGFVEGAESRAADVTIGKITSQQFAERLGLRPEEHWTDVRSVVEGMYPLTGQQQDEVTKLVAKGMGYREAFDAMELRDFDRAYEQILEPKIRKHLEASKPTQEIDQLVNDFRDNVLRPIKKENDLDAEMGDYLGMDWKRYEGRVEEFLTRHHIKTGAEKRAVNLGMKTTSPSQLSRMDALANLPSTVRHAGGTAAVEAARRDPALYGHITEAGEKYIHFKQARAERAMGFGNASVYKKLTRDLDQEAQREVLEELVREGMSEADALDIIKGSQEFNKRVKHAFQEYHLGTPEQIARRNELLDLAGRKIDENPYLKKPEERFTREAWEAGRFNVVPEVDGAFEREAWDLGRRSREAVEEGRATLLNDVEVEELAGLNARWEASDALQDWAARHPEPKPGELVYNVNPFDDHTIIRQYNIQAFEGIKALYRGFGTAAERAETAAEGSVRALDMLEKAGTGIKNDYQAVARMAEQLSPRAEKLGIKSEVLDRLSRGREGYLDEAVELADEGEDAVKLAEQLWEADRAAAFDNLVVNKQFAEGLENAQRHWQPTAESAGLLKNIYTKIHNTTRAHLTRPWPAFHMRNAATGAWQNIVTGSYDPTMIGGKLNPAAYAKPYQDGVDFMLRGKMPKGWEERPWFKGRDLNEREALEELRAAVVGHKVYEKHHTITSEIIGESDTVRMRDALDTIPGAAKPKRPKLGILQQMDPFGHAGGIGPNARLSEEIGQSTFIPLAVGEAVGEATESVQRFATFWGQGMHGHSMEEAARISRAAHVDYTKLTDFEKRVMKPLAAFYTFSRNMVPYQLAELLHKPGGLVAQTIKATNTMRGDQYVPEHVGRGLAIPLGEGADGKQRFISGFDLPHELLNDWFRIPNIDTSSVGGAFQSLVDAAGENVKSFGGQLSPPIKAAAEQAFGTQLYSGRDLADLNSNISVMLNQATGENAYVPQAADQVIAGSPFSRYLSSGVKVGNIATDRQRRVPSLVNLLTGIRMTDVDTGKAKRAAVRDRLEEVLRPLPEVRPFQRLYVKPEDLEKLNDEQRRLVDLYQGLR